MLHVLYTPFTASVTELKKNPMGLLKEHPGETVAILNRNEPVFYCVPAHVFEALMEALDTNHIQHIIHERRNDKEIEVSLDDL